MARQTSTREEALVAHTGANAYCLFEEGNLGTLTPGRDADLLVLDRGHHAVPLQYVGAEE